MIMSTLSESTDSYHLWQGSLPLLVSIPHVGIRLPDDLEPPMTLTAAQVRDTDWHLDRLYAPVLDWGASVIQPIFSRYVVDLNRPASDESLYPGQTTTGVCPTETFRGEALYQVDAPGAEHKQQRLQRYWQPYHTALRRELDRMLTIHGHALLWDAHSIASVLPRLFEGKLPDLNLGTNDGRSCAPGLQEYLQTTASRSTCSTVVNGRFKGGYITRHYGQPSQGVHAVQLEMCQYLYMNEEPPFEYLPEKAQAIQKDVLGLLRAGLDWLQQHKSQ